MHQSKKLREQQPPKQTTARRTEVSFWISVTKEKQKRRGGNKSKTYEDQNNCGLLIRNC